MKLWRFRKNQSRSQRVDTLSKHVRAFRWVRLTLLGLRVVNILVAAGVLFCVVVLDNIPVVVSWIIRVAVGAA